jgi:hypothetical protein
MLTVFTGVMLTAMISIGVYGSEALRSLRYAGARILVAVSLGIIALSFVDWLMGGSHFWRSTLAYAMGLTVLLLMTNRLIVGGILGAHAFRRRVLVLGAGHRAERLRQRCSKVAAKTQSLCQSLAFMPRHGAAASALTMPLMLQSARRRPVP